MAKKILYCASCESYTLHEMCSCGGKTIEKKPPKYSPADKYGRYRREAKKEQWKKEGLL